MMRLIFAALLATAATSVFAADVVLEEPVGAEGPRISGYGELFIGGLHIPDFSDFDEDDTFLVYGGAARVNVPINERWNLQADLTAERTDFINDLDLTTVGGALHAYWRDPSSYAFGIFAAYNHNTISDDDDELDLPTFFVGPEAQAYFGNFTVYGQAYYGQLELDDLPVDNFDIWGGRAIVRYFAQPNLRFDGELGYETMDVEGTDFDTFTAAAQAMYSFEGTPLSAFARYQFDLLSIDDADVDLDSHKFLVGVRASFGSDTLIDEDRNGATMDTRRPNLAFPFL